MTASTFVLFSAASYSFSFLSAQRAGTVFPAGTVPSVITMVFAQEFTVYKHVILSK